MACYQPRHSVQSIVSGSEFFQENLHSQRKEPLITTPLPERAWKKIGADLCEHQLKQFLVVIDYYTRFPEIAYMSSTTSDAVIIKMKDIFARWGVPEEIVRFFACGYALHAGQHLILPLM